MAAVAVGWLVAVAGAIALTLAASMGSSLAGNGEGSAMGSGISVVFGGLALAGLTEASVGAVLTVRRPGNVVGLVLLLAGILIPITFLGFIIGAVLTDLRGDHDTLAGLAALVGALAILPTLILAGPLVAIIFPDGRLPGPRWRWPLGAVAGAMLVGSAISLVRPGPVGASLADNPFGLSGLAGLVSLWAIGDVLIFAGLLFTLLLALVAVVVRVRRSFGVERVQLTWFVAANVVVGALLTLAVVDGATDLPQPTVVDQLSAWSLSLPSLAVGVAILRYRLYEIDRIISRTLAYVVITGLLVGLYAGIVVLIGGPLARVTGGDTISVAVSTLAVAALFQPLRRRVQSFVDRRFDRARYDGQRLAAAFAGRLRNEVDIAAVAADLDATVRVAVRPTTARLWVRGRTP